MPCMDNGCLDSFCRPPSRSLTGMLPDDVRWKAVEEQAVERLRPVIRFKTGAARSCTAKNARASFLRGALGNQAGLHTITSKTLIAHNHFRIKDRILRAGVEDPGITPPARTFKGTQRNTISSTGRIDSRITCSLHRSIPDTRPNPCLWVSGRFQGPHSYDFR